MDRAMTESLPQGTQANTVAGAIARGAADLSPGYFSLVMATGIVSIAAFLLGLPLIAQALLAINLVAYAVLWVLFLVRLVRYTSRLVEDFKNFSKSAGFFTMVAGTCVLGSQLVVLEGWTRAAAALWLLGTGLWAVLVYLFFFTMVSSETKPSLENGINGTWLIAVVSTQSVSVLGSFVAPVFPQGLEIVLFFTLFMYMLGGMLYLLLFTLIFYRLLYYRLAPEALSPPYWISMGALAITTLAGDRLMLNMSQASFLANLLPFIQGFTLFFWAFATWLIPLLALLGAWRHLARRVPLRYDPQYWGLVFPLGMYTVSTFMLAKATKLNFIAAIPEGFIYIALAAWLATALGLAVHLLKGMKR